MSLERLVGYFVRYAEEYPRKRPIKEVTEKLQSLETISRDEGLRPPDITALVDVAACGKLPASVCTRLIRSLIPAQSVPEVAVIKAVSWMCTNKPSSPIQTLLLRWILLVYELMDGHDKLHALYGVLFYFVENEMMCPFVCHLLYLLTRREDVVLFRLRALINLQQRVGSQSYVIGLLSVYKLYCPQLVTMSLPRVPKSFFRQSERVWAAHIRKVQVKNTDSDHSVAPADLSTNLRLDTSLLAPMAKRRRTELVPAAETCTVRPLGGNGRRFPTPGIGKSARTTTPIALIKSFDELLKTIDNVEMPARLASVFKDPHLQHVMSLQADPVVVHRLSYWVHHTLIEEFSQKPSPSVVERQGKLLALLVQFSDFLQESMPVWENFLVRYLHTWNGRDHREQVFHLIARIRLMHPTDLSNLVLEPLRKHFFTSSVYFKCQVLWCLTRLLRNYVAVERPRYQHTLETQTATSTEGTGSDGEPTGTRSDNQPQFHSMFAEDTEEFPSFQTIQNLLQFVERVSAVGLRAEGHHVLLTHCLVDFYTVVTQLCSTWNLPVVALPHRAAFYSTLFSTNVVAVARLSDLMTRYRTTFQELRAIKSKGQGSEAELQVCTQSVLLISTFNSTLLDMCNALWRDQCFVAPKPDSAFALVDKKQAGELGVVLKNEAFSLIRHPALMGYTVLFIRETQPQGKKIHFKSVKLVLEAFLEYLEGRHVASIPNFINLSIKRARKSDTASRESRLSSRPSVS